MYTDKTFDAAVQRFTAQMNEPAAQEWLAIRKKAGLKIDPETAEVLWWYAQTSDPYGVCSTIPDEFDQVGREYFARSPESDVWVSFDDLPKEVVGRIRQRIAAGDYSHSASQEGELLANLSEEELWATFASVSPETYAKFESMMRLPVGGLQQILKRRSGRLE